MRNRPRCLGGLLLALGVLLAGCSDPTAPGGALAPASGTYLLLSYDGKPVPANYETASYGSTTVLNGTLVLAFSIIDISVNYTEQDPSGVQTDAYNGGVSASWQAKTDGSLMFGDGLGGVYALTGRFHGDSILISVPDTLFDGTAHTGVYTFLRQR